MTEEVGLNDIKSILSIINVCTQRGAFKAEELEGIGKLYNKLNNFVNSAVEQLAKQSEETNKEVTNTGADEEEENVTGGHSMEFKEV